MRILLTGAAGFIGRHVLRRLLGRGHVVTGVDCFLSQVHGEHGWRKWPTEPTRAWNTSVRSAAASRDPANWDFDAVIHLAAEVGVGQSQYEPAKYVSANVSDTVRLWERIIEFRSRIRRVICASSMSLYGEGEYTELRDTGGHLARASERGWDAFDYQYTDGKSVQLNIPLTPSPTRESKRPEPASVYAQSKYDTEIYSLLLGKSYEIPTTALRFFNVAGPEQALSNAYTGVCANFACRTLNGKPALINEDGKQLRDFIHVEDVANAVVAAVEKPDLHGAFNVCTGRATSVLDVAELWRQIAHDECGIDAPEPEIRGTYRKGDIRHCFGSPLALKSALGWEAKRTVKDALTDMGRWIIANNLHVEKPVDRQFEAMGEMKASGQVVETR